MPEKHDEELRRVAERKQEDGEETFETRGVGEETLPGEARLTARRDKPRVGGRPSEERD